LKKKVEKAGLAWIRDFGWHIKFYIISSASFKNMCSRYQWLTPVILATQEAEMRRTVVQGQFRFKKKRSASPHLKNTQHKKSLWSGSSGRAPAF
jgi:hypothetical protein